RSVLSGRPGSAPEVKGHQSNPARRRPAPWPLPTSKPRQGQNKYWEAKPRRDVPAKSDASTMRDTVDRVQIEVGPHGGSAAAHGQACGRMKRGAGRFAAFG